MKKPWQFYVARRDSLLRRAAPVLHHVATIRTCLAAGVETEWIAQRLGTSRRVVRDIGRTKMWRNTGWSQ